MSLRDIFKSKPDKFLQLLSEQTNLTVKGLELLTVYLHKRDPETARRITAVEKNADEIRRILVEELMKTFITPIDREDIFTLSREIDDVLDYANTTVDEMEVLDVNTTEYMEKMAVLLRDASLEIKQAVERLQDRHYNVANEHARRAKALENQVESVYRQALADLFCGTKSVKHVVNMLKVREIYRHLSNASDREDDAANVISDIWMKTS
jgi:predicted phosphate transport protein (TIGR00153 family)